MSLFHVCQAYYPHAFIQAVFLTYDSALYKVDRSRSTPLLRFCGRLLGDAQQERDMEDISRYFAQEQPSAFGIRPRSRNPPAHFVCTPSAIICHHDCHHGLSSSTAQKESVSQTNTLASLACSSISTQKMDPRVQVIDFLIAHMSRVGPCQGC